MGGVRSVPDKINVPFLLLVSVFDYGCFCRQRAYLHFPVPSNVAGRQSVKTLKFTDETATHNHDFKRVYQFQTISAGGAGHGQHCLVQHEAETKGTVFTIFTTRPGDVVCYDVNLARL